VRRLGACGAAGTFLAATALASAIAHGQACVGDCNGDGQVTIGELITGVNLVLGNVGASSCAALDGNGDGSVVISELIQSVRFALNGCSVTPTPSELRTPTATGTATELATPSATQTATSSPTATPSSTPTDSAAPSHTQTPSATSIPTATFTGGPSSTPSPTPTRPASSSRVGPEFQINTFTYGSQFSADVAPDGSGGFTVVWDDDQLHNYTAFVRRYASDGSPLTDPVVVASGGAGRMAARIAADPSGAFVIAWENFTTSNVDIFARRYDGTATALGPRFLVNESTLRSAPQPRVGAAQDGSFLVAWQQDDGSEVGVVARLYPPTGSTGAAPMLLNTYTVGRQRPGAVAASPDGTYLVVWDSTILSGPSQDGSDGGIFARRCDSAGGPIGTEFQVNSYTVGRQTMPVVGIDGKGNFVVVWESRQALGNYGLFGQRFDRVGARVGTEFQVSSYTYGGQALASTTMDDGGNFVVLWQDPFQDGSPTGVFGQQFNPEGQRLGSEFQANIYTLGAQLAPRVSATGPGQFIAVWNSGPQAGGENQQDGALFGVFGQRFAGQ
jgi:hypothetical protein